MAWLFISVLIVLMADTCYLEDILQETNEEVSSYCCNVYHLKERMTPYYIKFLVIKFKLTISTNYLTHNHRERYFVTII